MGIAPVSATRVSASASGGASLELAPFNLVPQKAAGAGQLLSFSWAAMGDLKEAGQVTIRDFPISASITVDLSLETFQVFDAATQFLAVGKNGETPVSPPDIVLLRGQIEGNPGSQVFLGVSAHGINGYIESGGPTYIVSSGPAGGNLAAAHMCMITPLGEQFSPRPEELFCEMLPEGLPEELLAASASVDTLPPLWRRCLLLVECDYDYYKRLGNDLDAAMAYASILIGAASEIYERDAGVAFWLNVLRVWTTVEDPYVTCGLYGLEEFKNYGNAHLMDKVWNIAHRMTGCGGGGSGYYTALCPKGSDRGKNPYSISTILGYFPYPALSDTNTWDLFLVTHELGHNFGSPHTHCYAPPVDRCRGDEGGCYRGVDVCERGTIMSYCFRCNGIADIDLRLHPRVVELIRGNLNQSCLPVVGNGVRITNATSGLVRVDSIRPSEPWLSAGPGTFLIAAGAERDIGVTVDWSQVAAATAEGTLRVFSTRGGTGSMDLIQVSANRRRPFPEFAASADSGCWPLSIAFTDLSNIGPDSWYWDFGDGTRSGSQNPVHVYSLPGIYTVRFTAANACGPERLHRAFSVHVTEAGLCCALPPVLIERYDSLPEAYDLWSCAHDAIGPLDENTYEIAHVDMDSAGISVYENRYLSIMPKPGWFGQTWVRYRVSDPLGCICENQLSVIVNDPPRVHLLFPDAGVDTINADYDIRWSDSDRDQNARIYLYYEAEPACTGKVRINPNDIFEDQMGPDGIYRWVLGDIPDGYYRLHATIADVFVSSADSTAGLLLVDRTEPVTTATMTCTQLDANGWCNGNVRVELAATDTLSGVAATYYSLNGAREQVYTGPFLVGLEGATTLEYYSVDRAGNVETLRRSTHPIRVDQSAPVISGMQADNNSFVSGDFTSSTPTFSIQLTDAGAGLAPERSTVTIRPGTGEGPAVFAPDSSGFAYDPVTRRISVSMPLPLLPGSQELSVEIEDALGNRAAASLTFTIGTDLHLLDVVNHPNPFVRETWFTFKLTGAAEVTIRIYDLSGELMRTLGGITGQVGYNEIHWDGLSQSGLSLANGAYFYEIVAKGANRTIRHLDKLAILR
ncbi:MAG: M12 family metallo-peptidase [Candidatus Zixiibacteriota bacterium]